MYDAKLLLLCGKKITQMYFLPPLFDNLDYLSDGNARICIICYNFVVFTPTVRAKVFFFFFFSAN